MDILERLAAESDLRRIVGLYPQYADDADAEGFASLFTADGELLVGDEVVKGRAAIAEWLLGTLKGLPMRHMMLNSVIEVLSPTEARGSLDMALLLLRDKRWTIGPAPRYADTYAKTDEGWKFARRTLELR